MKSSLQTLSRIQKFNINEQRKLLVSIQEQQEKLQTELQDLNRQFEEEKNFSRSNGYIGDFGAYVKRYITHKEELETQIELLEQKINQIRDAITDMFKEQKTFEIVDENRQKRQIHDEEIKIQKQLDEIGTNSYIKHQEQ